jgi:hypothetical protein
MADETVNQILLLNTGVAPPGDRGGAFKTPAISEATMQKATVMWRQPYSGQVVALADDPAISSCRNTIDPRGLQSVIMFRTSPPSNGDGKERCAAFRHDKRAWCACGR